MVDKLGVRAVVIPGLFLLGLALYLLTAVSPYEPYSQMQLGLCIRGFGLGLCLQPLIVSALSEIKPQLLAQASAVNTTLRFVVSSLAISVISTYVTAQTNLHYAHIAETAIPTSPLGHLITLLEAAFISKGYPARRHLVQQPMKSLY